MGGEHHFAHRGEKTSVAAIVIGEQQLTFPQQPARFKQRTQTGRVVEIRRFLTYLRQHLRERRGTQTIASGAEIYQNQARWRVEL